jgi:hypothetical protein
VWAPGSATFFRPSGRNEALRQSVVAELIENRIALARRKRTRLHRSAWDAARAVNFDKSVFEVVATAYVALDRVGVVIDLSLARSAGATGSQLEQIMSGGGPINYNNTIKKVEAAILALGAPLPQVSSAED